MKQPTQTLLSEIRKAAAEAPRMYFAPLIGAMHAIRTQYRSAGRHGHHEQRQSKEPASGQVHS